jgi:serine/threonine-protein kinase RsbW
MGEGWTVRTRGPDTGSTARWAGSFDDSLHAADVRLTLPALPENVALARRVLATLADTLGLSAAVRDDLRLAVTEACTNVVRHAYHDRPGRIEVLARPEADALQVIVSDTGSGIVASPDAAGPGYGLGLIEVLADRLEIDHAPGQGSRLQMWFARHRQIRETA